MIEKERLVALVRAVQQGRDDAAGKLYDTFYNDIYYFILKTVKDDPELAADLTQDTFMEILETIGKLQEPAAFITWSRQIAYHRCTAYFRKRKDILLDEAEDGYSAFDTIEEDRSEFIPGEELDKKEFQDTILSMIRSLPPEQASAIVLRYMDELSVKDIAMAQGVSEGTVKSRLNYGRKALKEAVETYEKKHGIRLHCAGVVPILVWFFRAYRLANSISLTAPAAAAFSAASTSATAAAAGTAAAGVATEKSGLAAAISSISKAAATKAVAAVAAVGVAVAGVVAIVNKPDPLPEVWSGYVQEYTVHMSPDEGSQRMNITQTPVENGRMFFELTLEEETGTQILGNLTVTWDDGETYTSPVVIHDKMVTEKTCSFEVLMDPLYLRTDPDTLGEYNVNSAEGDSRFQDNIFFEIYLEYNKGKNTLTIHTDSNMICFLEGTLSPASRGESAFERMECTSIYSGEGYNNYLWYIDGTWKYANNGEQFQYIFRSSETENTVLFARREGSDFVWAECPVVMDPVLVIPDQVDGYPVQGILPMSQEPFDAVVLPQTLTVLPDVAFYDCQGLTTLQIPGSVKTIGRSFLYCCHRVTKLTIPEGTEVMAPHAAMFCAGLRSVHLPATLTQLQGAPIFGCLNVESLTVAEGNPVYHSSGNCIIETESKVLVGGCATSVIPEGQVTVIGRYAFAGNRNLFDITIPEGVTEIRYGAFAGCDVLYYINLPGTIQRIDDQAFKNCQRLSDIYFDGTMEQFRAIEGIDWDAPYQDFFLTVYCTDGQIDIR